MSNHTADKGLVINDYENFGKDFLEAYFSRGFGSVTKSETEILLFHLLKKYGALNGNSNSISRILKIPETKVRNLAYEATLKHDTYSEDYIKNAIVKILSSSILQGGNKKVLFSVEDRFIRTQIRAILKEGGHFADSSFNSEIISVHIDSFAYLLDSVITDSKKKKLLKNEGKKAINENDNLKFRNVAVSLLEGALGEIGKGTIEMAKLAIFSQIF